MQERDGPARCQEWGLGTDVLELDSWDVEEERRGGRGESRGTQVEKVCILGAGELSEWSVQ